MPDGNACRVNLSRAPSLSFWSGPAAIHEARIVTNSACRALSLESRSCFASSKIRPRLKAQATDPFYPNRFRTSGFSNSHDIFQQPRRQISSSTTVLPRPACEKSSLRSGRFHVQHALFVTGQETRAKDYKAVMLKEGFEAWSLSDSRLHGAHENLQGLTPEAMCS